MKPSKYVPAYLDYLKEPKNLEAVADLIEEIKKAHFFDFAIGGGDSFSVPATNAILKKLDTLIPGWRQ
jgi:hypothetical protein